MPPAEEGPSRDIFRRVRKFVAAMHGVPEEQITLDTPLLPGASVRGATTSLSSLEDLSADSLDVVELVMEVEEEFGLELRDQEAEALDLEVVARWTVRDLVNFIDWIRSAGG